MTVWDDKLIYDRIIDLLSQKEGSYTKFNRARDSIVTYMRPDLGSDTTPDGDGGFFGDNIYAGVGPWSVGVMSRGFQGGLVSAGADWLAHKMSYSELDDIDELDEWLQWVKRHISDVYLRSNFYKVLPNFTKDGITIGSPLMFIEETDRLGGVITFFPQHYKTVTLFYDGNNDVEGVIIKDENWTIKRISDKFASTKPEQELKLSKATNNAIRDGQLYNRKTIIRAVFKQDNPLWDKEGFNNPSAPWISVYFEDKTEEERKNTPLLTEKYFSKPFTHWDYDKKPWESVSRTPAFEAIYDVVSQQEISKEMRENLKLINRPPRAVMEDHRNIVDFRPEGISLIPRGDWEMLPKAIEVVGNIKMSKDELEINAEKVKRWFHTGQFMKFTDLTSTLRQQPTATQIIKIAAELSVQVSPGIASYTTGFLADTDSRMLDIEIRAGRGPFDPEVMDRISAIIAGVIGDKISEVSLTPIFTGPLARAQKVKQELDPIIEGLGVGGAVFELFPDSKNSIREHGLLKRIFEATGFPLTEFKPEDEYNDIIDALNEARAQEKQQLMAIEMAKAIPAVSGEVSPDSVLAGVGA